MVLVGASCFGSSLLLAQRFANIRSPNFHKPAPLMRLVYGCLGLSVIWPIICLRRLCTCSSGAVNANPLGNQ
jgi:hypothetical protein